MGAEPVVEPSAGAGGSFAWPLVGLAHGSRHRGISGSTAELMAAVSTLGQMPAYAAYLDLVDPDLTTITCRLAAAGYSAAVVTPLLFTEAFHASVDVPEAVRAASAQSGMQLFVSEILGTGDDVAQVVQQGMAAAGIGPATSVVLVSVGSSSVAANEAVYDLAARLGRQRSGQVAAAFATRSPRAAEVLFELAPPAAIVPLFLSPALLLEPLAELAAERELTLAHPLGTLAAPLLVSRYRETLRASQRTLADSAPELR